MSEYWKAWLKAAGIRAIKTIAQTAIATIGTATVMGEVNWIAVVLRLFLRVFCRCLPASPASPK